MAAVSASAAALMVQNFPYTGPQHDPQKLVRASLITSCLRGQERSMQFQDGESGRVLRRKIKRQPMVTCKRLLRVGSLHRVITAMGRLAGESRAAISWLPPRELLHTHLVTNPLSAAATAVQNGHHEVVEWLLCRYPALSPHWTRKDTLFGAPMHNWAAGKLLTAAIQLRWSWGVDRIMRMVAESTDPAVVFERECGAVTDSLVVCAARVGAPHALEWVERFASGGVPAGGMSRYELLQYICRSCTVKTLEWLAVRYYEFPLQDKELNTGLEAALGTELNLSVVEWLVAQRRPGGIQNGTDLLSQACANGHLRAAEFLHRSGIGSVRSTQVRVCCEGGHVQVARWMLSHGASTSAVTLSAHDSLAWTEFVHNAVGVQWTQAAADLAAQRGNLVVIEWGFRHSQDSILPSSLDAAAESGCTKLLKWLTNMQPDMQCTASALEPVIARYPHKSLCTVEFLFQWQRELKPRPHALDLAARAGLLPLLEMLHARDPRVQCTWMAFAGAARFSELEVMHWLRRTFPDVFCDAVSAALPAAAMAGRLDSIEFLLRGKSLATISHNTWKRAMSDSAQGGELKVLEALYERRLQAASQIQTQTQPRQQLQCEDGERSEVDSVLSSAMLDWAIYGGHVHVAQWLHSHGVEPGERVNMRECARRGHLACIEFCVLECGVPCTEETLLGAIAGRQRAVVRFLLSQPLPRSVVHKACKTRDHEILRMVRDAFSHHCAQQRQRHQQQRHGGQHKQGNLRDRYHNSK